MLKKMKSNTGKIRNLYYDSLEELYFFHWCFELLDRGYIKSIERADPFHLSDEVINNYSLKLKTKSKPMTQKLLAGHVYTPEVVITWSKKGIDKLVWVMSSHIKRDKVFTGMEKDNEIITIVEVKPIFDQNNMERLVRLNIKWVYQKYGIMVDIIKNPILFETTFTPKAYLKTPTGKTRKIKWKIRFIDDFLKQKDHNMYDKKLQKSKASLKA